MCQAVPPFAATLADAVGVSARGELSELLAAFDELSRDLAHPAALLDAGLVYLALNRPYARMVRLPASALVGKEHSRVHGDRQAALAILEAFTGGAPCEVPLPKPVQGPEGAVYRARRVTPIRDSGDRALAMVLEYCPDAAEGGAADVRREEA